MLAYPPRSRHRARGSCFGHAHGLDRAHATTPTGLASDLDLTDPLAEVITEGGRVAVLGTVPFEALVSWTTLTRTRDASRFERVV